MSQRAMAILVVLFLVGCGPNWRPLAPNAIAEKQPKTIVLVVPERPVPFGLYPPLAVRGTMIGAAMSLNERSKWLPDLENIEKNDPAIAIGQRLVGALAKSHGLTVRPTIRMPGESEGDPDYGADLVLKATTVNWVVNRFKVGTDYGVWYSGKVQLIAAPENRELASGTCEFPTDPDDRGRSGSYDDLIHDHFLVVKEAIKTAEQDCLKRFETSLLAAGLGGASPR